MPYTKSLKNLIKEFGNLPGIGGKTAERLGLYILGTNKEEAFALSQAIALVKEQIRYCDNCCHIADENLCVICSNPKRDFRTICVVEQVKDLIAIEKTGVFQGWYHVLHGRLAPLENKHPQDTTVDRLLERIKKSSTTDRAVQEVILATNPNIEGDTTALYICDLLKTYKIKISRIARGIPSGGSIEFANQAMLTDALAERQLVQP